MFAESYNTQSLPKSQQLDGWRGWYDSLFDVTPADSRDQGFVATNSNWTALGLTISNVASPANTVGRTKSIIRRNPVDHWVLTVSMQSATDIETTRSAFEAPPATLFILSLGEEMRVRRTKQDTRVQLLLARDSFEPIAPLLDAARGMALTTPTARLLADYVHLLRKNAPDLKPETFSAIRNAVQAMLAAFGGRDVPTQRVEHTKPLHGDLSGYVQTRHRLATVRSEPSAHPRVTPDDRRED